MDIDPSAILPRRPNFGFKKAIFGQIFYFEWLIGIMNIETISTLFNLFKNFLCFEPFLGQIFAIFGPKWDFKQKEYLRLFDKSN